jgi:hypothetical protein
MRMDEDADVTTAEIEESRSKLPVLDWSSSNAASITETFSVGARHNTVTLDFEAVSLLKLSDSHSHNSNA